jgi:MHS family alpha-ketoglutarate permease-like MFS transporter
VAVFGGTAPYLQQWLTSIGSADLFNVYSVVLLVISAAVIFSIPETKAKDLSH